MGGEDDQQLFVGTKPGTVWLAGDTPHNAPSSQTARHTPFIGTLRVEAPAPRSKPCVNFPPHQLPRRQAHASAQVGLSILCQPTPLFLHLPHNTPYLFLNSHYSRLRHGISGAARHALSRNVCCSSTKDCTVAFASFSWRCDTVMLSVQRSHGSHFACAK